MSIPHVLTLVADRTATTLDDATIARVREAIQAGPPATLQAGEAADLVCTGAPDMGAVCTVLAGAPIDAVAQPVEGRRKALLIADMDSTDRRRRDAR